MKNARYDDRPLFGAIANAPAFDDQAIVREIRDAIIDLRRDTAIQELTSS